MFQVFGRACSDRLTPRGIVGVSGGPFMKSFKNAIGVAAQQIKGSGQPVYTPSSPRNGEVFFTKNVQAKLKQGGLSETDALDVYYHGSIVKNNMMVRKHNGYEIGIWFFADRVTGKPIIRSVWKRTRR